MLMTHKMTLELRRHALMIFEAMISRRWKGCLLALQLYFWWMQNQSEQDHVYEALVRNMTMAVQEAEPAARVNDSSTKR